MTNKALRDWVQAICLLLYKDTLAFRYAGEVLLSIPLPSEDMREALVVCTRLENTPARKAFLPILLEDKDFLVGNQQVIKKKRCTIFI